MNIIPFINKYNCDGIKYSSETDDWKTLEKDNPTIAHNILDIKKKKYVLLIFQKLIQIVKKKKIVNDSRCRKRRLTLSCSKTLSALLHGITSKHKGD